MPIDCSTCEAFAMQPTQVVKPCLHGGTALYRDDASAGEKQLPLLHLMYTLCASHFEPQERQVRATWRAPVYTAAGNRRVPPLYTFNLSAVEGQVHHLIGMVLAQRVRALPVWAQLGRADQIALARQIAGDVLHPDTPELQTLGMFEILNGALLDLRGVKLAASWLNDAEGKWESMNTEVRDLERRIRNAEQALERRVLESGGGPKASWALQRVSELRGLIAEAFPDPSPFAEDGRTLKNSLAVEFLLDWMDDGDAREMRSRMQEYSVLLSE
ncbi:MAG TPA: hypothetical protein VK936_12030, partial [Longimicrobiales bacterium]|nr:hypothetical protein [Longimicrobiales bacterium]